MQSSRWLRIGVAQPSNHAPLELGKLAEARRELQDIAVALARALGPHSPPLAQTRGYLCECDLREHVVSASCDAALATAEAVFGETNPQLVWFLVMVGQARMANGGDALAPLERALAISEHGTVMRSDHALAQGFLALALVKRDPARARQLAREARGALADQPALVKELDAKLPSD